MLNTFLGPGLKASIKKCIHEFNIQKKLSTDSIADLVAHLIRRLTRIGIIGLIAAILPTVFLIIQTNYLGKQNEKIDKQNELINNQNSKLVQQNYLVEAQRRATLQFELSEILNRIDEELEINKNGQLSGSLKSRIVALTLAMKPYRSYENDTLKAPFNFEKGQLFTYLVNSVINEMDLSEILSNGDFSYMKLKNITLGIRKRHNSLSKNKNDSYPGLRIHDFTFKNSILENVTFDRIRFDQVKFEKTLINNLIWRSARSKKILFVDSELSESRLHFRDNPEKNNLNESHIHVTSLFLRSSNITKTRFQGKSYQTEQTDAIKISPLFNSSNKINKSYFLNIKLILGVATQPNNLSISDIVYMNHKQNNNIEISQKGYRPNLNRIYSNNEINFTGDSIPFILQKEIFLGAVYEENNWIKSDYMNIHKKFNDSNSVYINDSLVSYPSPIKYYTYIKTKL